MKVSVVLALFLAALAAAHPGLKPEAFMNVAKYIDTCTKKHGTKQGDVFKLIFDKTPVEDQALKCTLDCYMMEAGYLKDGKIDWDTAKEKTKKAFTDQESIDKALKIAEACEKNVVVDEKAECPFGEPVLRCLLSEADNLLSPILQDSVKRIERRRALKRAISLLFTVFPCPRWDPTNHQQSIEIFKEPEEPPSFLVTGFWRVTLEELKNVTKVVQTYVNEINLECTV